MLLILFQLAIFLREHSSVMLASVISPFGLIFILLDSHIFLFVFTVLLSRQTALEASCVASSMREKKNMSCSHMMLLAWQAQKNRL